MPVKLTWVVAAVRGPTAGAMGMEMSVGSTFLLPTQHIYFQ